MCDKAKKECVPRPDAGADAGAGGGDAGAGDAGDPYQAGLVEGGGCSCRTSVASAGSPLAMFAGAFAALFAARRRRSNHR
jgi:MYXO-CTERM domain-containing protein